ncbi:MAG: HAD family hydrolase [Kiloniellales bacterium]
MAEPPVDSVIFDLGGVLIDWNPRYLYRRLFDDEAAMEAFLVEVWNTDWIRQHDAGRPFAETVAELTALFPHHAEPIRALQDRWPETMGGAIDDTVALLDDLRTRGLSLYALSNFSAETFPHARERFDFLAWFDGLVISGECGLLKPDPRIYRLLFERYGIDPQRALFIDDVADNVAGAEAVGLRARRFTTPAALRRDLSDLALL